MRYIRQTALREIGEIGQRILNDKIVTIVGIGALGTNAASLLARAGVNLKLIDDGYVEKHNLQRQVLFTEEDIGKSKVEAAKQHLQKINSEIRIEAYDLFLTENEVDILRADLILDCLDNMKTRFIINNYCLTHNIPWIHSAAIRTKGTVFNMIPGKACLNCLYSKEADLERCSEVGILNTIASVIGSIQATQAIKILLDKDYEEDLIRVNIWSNTLDKIKVARNPNCESCLLQKAI